MLTQVQKERVKDEVNQTIEIVNRSAFVDMYVNQVKGKSQFDGTLKCDVIYNHGTEDMRTYLSHVKEAKKILTATCSGEQILNSILIGAKKIDAFDSNPLSKRGAQLKVAAAKSLTRKEFSIYFNRFGEEKFNRIVPNLDEEARSYWCAIYDILSPEIISESLFPLKRLNSLLIKEINPYLDDDKYIELQKKLNDVDITYLDVPLYYLHEVLSSNQYDFINLSNIYEYLVYELDGKKEGTKKFKDYVMKELYTRLNENGKILVAYMYAYNDFVNSYIKDNYRKDPSLFVPSGAITINEMMNYYQGFTAQNLSYSFLLDEFENEDITKLRTRHVEYGQSPDMSSDFALILNKRNG